MTRQDGKTTTTFTPTVNSTEFSVRPERLYHQCYKNTILDSNEPNITPKIGDIVPITFVEYDFFTEKISCWLEGYKHQCFIRDINYYLPEMEKNIDDPLTPVLRRLNINKKIVAKVINIEDDGTLELSRTEVMKEAFEFLKNNVGNDVEATVETIKSYGAFIDIGYGLTSLLKIQDFSRCRYDNLYSHIKVGDVLPKVRILDFDPQTSHFTVSQKDAYHKVQLIPGTIQLVKVGEKLDSSGYFVEYNPSTTGIMDTPNDMYIPEGTYAYVYIKRLRSKGFCSRFLGI